ncbi:unnamed protein product [Oikopleura dioica]|uniref:Uncharacterized protein n=1 Tax=Oikopleura dioica TaxID=34765 RepID=E4Y1A9_OIKDI|nr:unnamed protein product [Oikopleura dioica]
MSSLADLYKTREGRAELEAQLEILKNMSITQRMASGELTLEVIAIKNEPMALELIQELILSRDTMIHTYNDLIDSDPLKPNSKKLFPYHFAQNEQIFDALTPPPIDRRAYLVTLARSNATEDEKISLLQNAVNNNIPLDMTRVQNKGYSFSERSGFGAIFFFSIFWKFLY